MDKTILFGNVHIFFCSSHYIQNTRHSFVHSHMVSPLLFRDGCIDTVYAWRRQIEIIYYLIPSPFVEVSCGQQFSKQRPRRKQHWLIPDGLWGLDSERPRRHTNHTTSSCCCTLYQGPHNYSQPPATLFYCHLILERLRHNVAGAPPVRERGWRRLSDAAYEESIV